MCVCVWLCVFIIFFCSYSGDPLDQCYFPVGESLNILITNTNKYKIMDSDVTCWAARERYALSFITHPQEDPSVSKWELLPQSKIVNTFFIYLHTFQNIPSRKLVCEFWNANTQNEETRVCVRVCNVCASSITAVTVCDLFILVANTSIDCNTESNPPLPKAESIGEKKKLEKKE